MSTSSPLSPAEFERQVADVQRALLRESSSGRSEKEVIQQVKDQLGADLNEAVFSKAVTREFPERALPNDVVPSVWDRHLAARAEAIESWAEMQTLSREVTPTFVRDLVHNLECGVSGNTLDAQRARYELSAVKLELYREVEAVHHPDDLQPPAFEKPTAMDRLAVTHEGNIRLAFADLVGRDQFLMQALFREFPELATARDVTASAKVAASSFPIPAHAVQRSETEAPRVTLTSESVSSRGAGIE